MVVLPKPYEYGRGYIILPLPHKLFERLPDTVEVEGARLVRKEEFHVSLVCLKRIDPMLGDPIISTLEVESRILSLFCEYIRQTPPQFAGFTRTLRYAVKEDRASVVIECIVAHLEEFFSTCERALSIVVSPQPTHVTLYARTPHGGIGINSKEEMEKLPMLELTDVRDALVI